MAATAHTLSVLGDSEVLSFDTTTGFKPYDENAFGPLEPTEQLYAKTQELIDYLNDEIVVPNLRDKEGKPLGPVPTFITTLQSSGRCKGFMAKCRWSDHHGRYLDEVSVVMGNHAHGDLKDVASTFLHEMLHVKQHADGKPGKSNYHNRQFSDWMKMCGLQTSQTGRPGGRDIGVGMSDYVIKGSVFDRALDNLAASGFSLPWETILTSSLGGHVVGDGNIAMPSSVTAPGTKPKDKSKTRFNCPKCGESRIWGKPSTSVACLRPGCDGEPLIPEAS